MSVRTLERDQIGQRGSLIYETSLRSTLEARHHGQFVAIDVESEAYEIADEAAIAVEQLWARLPDAQVYVERMGYPAAFHAYAIGLL
jgi:hypothetical protein